MTLADAIRKGAMQRPQCYGLSKAQVGNELGTCAMSAAYEGVFGELPETTREARRELGRVFSEMEQVVAHPVYGGECNLGSALVSLNDGPRWTREQIADWLDTL